MRGAGSPAHRRRHHRRRPPRCHSQANAQLRWPTRTVNVGVRSGLKARQRTAWIGARTASGGPGNVVRKCFGGPKGPDKLTARHVPPFQAGDSLCGRLPGPRRVAPHLRLSRHGLSALRATPDSIVSARIADAGGRAEVTAIRDRRRTGHPLARPPRARRQRKTQVRKPSPGPLPHSRHHWLWWFDRNTAVS